MTLIGYPSRRLSRAQHGFTFLRIGAMSSKLQNTRGGANFFESLESRQFLSTTVTPALTTTPVGATTIQHFSTRVTAATRLTFVANPATTLMGQPFTMSAKLTAGGLPLPT